MLTDYFITNLGQEPISEFEDKLLKISQITDHENPVIRHFYSDAVNADTKVVRFYIHISMGEDGVPVLWLSRRRYKTCRAGHRYFQIFPLKRDGRLWKAKWRNTAFMVSQEYNEVVIVTNNKTKYYDIWFDVESKSKESSNVRLYTRDVRSGSDDEDAPF